MLESVGFLFYKGQAPGKMTGFGDNHLEESSYYKVQFKNFSPFAKTSCPPAGNMSGSPGIQYVFSLCV